MKKIKCFLKKPVKWVKFYLSKINPITNLYKKYNKIVRDGHKDTCIRGVYPSCCSCGRDAAWKKRARILKYYTFKLNLKLRLKGYKKEVLFGPYEPVDYVSRSIRTRKEIEKILCDIYQVNKVHDIPHAHPVVNKKHYLREAWDKIT